MLAVASSQSPNGAICDSSVCKAFFSVSASCGFPLRPFSAAASQCSLLSAQSRETRVSWTDCLKIYATNIQGIHKRMGQFRKLTRTIFLNLHGHNEHRRQRQLSKFLMRYQQFASLAYCGAAGPVYKMALQHISVCSVLMCPDL
jgi:hypothetical protein